MCITSMALFMTFALGPETFAIVDANMQWTVEPGTYHFLIGSSRADIRLMGKITFPNSKVKFTQSSRQGANRALLMNSPAD